MFESFYSNLIAEDRYRMILAALCSQVVEEPIERGFRVKLIL